MARFWSGSLLFLATQVVAQTQSQYQWPEGASCYWRDARSAIVRDTFYLEGGILGSMINQASGSISGNAAGLVSYNLSTPFDENSNFTDLFLPQKFLTNPLLKPRVNGYMFADYSEWYTFGGRAYPSYSNQTPDTTISRDALYSPNTAAINPSLGISNSLTPPYLENSSIVLVTNGAGVSVPTESLGFYFSGLKTFGSTQINYVAQVNTSSYPSTLVDSMIVTNMKSFGNSNWTTVPLPDTVTPRADAILTWIPVGTQGSLVLIGGVEFPETLAPNCNLNSSMVSANNADGPSYMTAVQVYDIANDVWYTQQTNGGQPPQLAQGCAVVASNSDNSINNIYVYGGYNGNDKTSVYDDVWILSIPAFTWIKVPSTDASHGRFAHSCAKPYPDQMMVVGGTTMCNSILQTPMFADVFNLSSLTWTKSYNPSVWSEYVVPSAVSSAIKATPTAYMTPGMQALFQIKYTVTPETFYPYASANTSTPSPTPNPKHKSNSKSWIIPVAVVVPIVALIIIAGLIWLFMRRRRDQDQTEGGRSRKSVGKWVNDQSPQNRSQRSDDEMTQVNSAYHEATGDTYFPKSMPHTTTAELNSDSNPDTPLASPFTPSNYPGSPSSHGGTELYTPPVELAGNHSSLFGSPNIKSHPMYPLSVGGHVSTATGGSVASPAAGPITPYELPHNRSNEDILPQPPNDLILGQNSAERPQSPRLKPTRTISDDHPDTSIGGVSPEQGPVSVPNTPPNRPIMTARKPLHTRAASSVSSNGPDDNSAMPSPRDDERRITQISNLPDSPTNVASGSVSPAEDLSAVSPASPSQIGGIGDRDDMNKRVEKEIRRKELRKWPRAQGDSVFKEEEDDMKPSERGTI